MPPKRIDDTYKKGDKVKARWSGSNAFYDAKVLDVYLKTCKVQFDDGTVFNVKLSDMKSPKTEKKEETEPVVKRTRSRSRSTGRNRSRSRSPARNEKKKTTVKSEKKTPSKVEKSKSDMSPKATNSVKKDEVDSLGKSSLTREKIGSVKEEATTSQSSVTTSNSYMKSLYVSVERSDSPSDARMRSSRLSSLRSSASPPKTKISHEKANAKKLVLTLKKDDAKYSDDEESDEEIKVIPKGPSKIRQTSTFLLTLLKVVLMPASFLFLAFACTKRQCTVLEAPQFYSKLKDMSYVFKIPFPSVLLFHLSVCLLSLIPLGKKVSGFPYGPKGVTKEYRLNGIICLMLFAAVFAICSYFGLNMNWGYEKFKSLSFSIVLYCIFCSLVVHAVSLINGDGDTESKIPAIGNFFNGIYFNPCLFGKVDVKTSFVRAGLIGSVLINLSILLKFFLMRGFVTVPLSLTAGMQIFFVLDYFIREEKMLSTATYTSDSVGYGFIMTTAFLVPIGLTLQTVYLYIFESKAHLTPHWCYAAMLVLYLCGYYIYMSSGNLKHNFRKNPFSPNLSDVDSIPTSQKKRLISSKMWGVVRHPNYLGLIIMAVSWTLPCGFSHFTPFGPLIMLIVALILRCIRIESECKEKYGPAWNNYTEKVRSRLIPYIF